jgi:hypothetical protein
MLKDFACARSSPTRPAGRRRARRSPIIERAPHVCLALAERRSTPVGRNARLRAGRESNGRDARDACKRGHVSGRHPRFDPVLLGRVCDDACADPFERVEYRPALPSVADYEVEAAAAIDALHGCGQVRGIVPLEAYDFRLLSENEDRRG